MQKITAKPRANTSRPTSSQLSFLRRGLEQPGGKLPLFDSQGQRISNRTIKACLEHGWCERWFNNPLKPDWLVCKLTDKGRDVTLAHSLKSDKK